MHGLFTAADRGVGLLRLQVFCRRRGRQHLLLPPKLLSERLQRYHRRCGFRVHVPALECRQLGRQAGLLFLPSSLRADLWTVKERRQ